MAALGASLVQAVVVGAGFAGAAAALGLASAGARVTLLEREPTVGGKARVATAAGATIDLGPTVLSELGPLRALVAEAGERFEDLVPLTRCDPALVATFGNGARLPWHHTDQSALTDALAALAPSAPGDWRRFLDLGHRALALWRHFLEHGDVTGVRALARFVAAGSCADAAPFVRRASLARLLEAEVQTPALRRVLGHFARFVGLEPATAPSVTVVIPFLLATSGIWHPHGGIQALARTLTALAVKRGAVVVTGTTVARAETGHGRLVALHTDDGRRVAGDVFVLAVDIGKAASWLPRGTLRGVHRLTPAAAARVAWWVMEGASPDTPHHALHFPDEHEPIYVATPTVTDPALAPGATVLHAVMHGPAGAPTTPTLAAEVRARLERAGQWPRGRVLAEGVSGGEVSCYGYAIGRRLLRAFRPSQRVPTLDNVFLAGGSVFPGPGVANAVRSGRRAAALAMMRGGGA